MSHPSNQDKRPTGQHPLPALLRRVDRDTLEQLVLYVTEGRPDLRRRHPLSRRNGGCPRPVGGDRAGAGTARRVGRCALHVALAACHDSRELRYLAGRLESSRQEQLVRRAIRIHRQIGDDERCLRLRQQHLTSGREWYDLVSACFRGRRPLRLPRTSVPAEDGAPHGGKLPDLPFPVQRARRAGNPYGLRRTGCRGGPPPAHVGRRPQDSGALAGVCPAAQASPSPLAGVPGRIRQGDSGLGRALAQVAPGE